MRGNILYISYATGLFHNVEGRWGSPCSVAKVATRTLCGKNLAVEPSSWSTRQSCTVYDMPRACLCPRIDGSVRGDHRHAIATDDVGARDAVNITTEDNDDLTTVGGSVPPTRLGSMLTASHCIALARVKLGCYSRPGPTTSIIGRVFLPPCRRWALSSPAWALLQRLSVNE